MKVGDKYYQTVWMKDSDVYMIDQNKLPFFLEIKKCKTYLETCEAIKDMTVRGAGAIGATAGYAMAQAFFEVPGKNSLIFIENARNIINNTRPTAQNLFYATGRVFRKAINSKNYEQDAIDESKKIADEDVQSCKKIGEYGNDLIKSGFNIGTHCNAGWLAFVNYGTALSPIYIAKEQGKKISIYVDETRPRGQGAKLTAWELKNENIPHTIIPDNAGAYLMSQGKINLIIVGADRITKNGDTANKIGTLEKAIIAKEYGIPFYVAAPTSTFDLKCNSGKDIPIEERNQDEVLYQTGLTKENNLERVLVCSPGSPAFNPAFDVTDAKYITGIITEKGIINPDENSIKRLFS